MVFILAFEIPVMSIAIVTNREERLADLGNVPAARVRSEPAPGVATLKDVVRFRNTERRLYELVDRTLVEKLWMVDHRSRTVTVFRTPQDATVVTEGQN